MISGIAIVAPVAAVIALAFLKVAKPHELIVKTGFMVEGKQFGTSMVVIPALQQFSVINMTARIAPGVTEGIYTEESHTIKVAQMKLCFFNQCFVSSVFSCFAQFFIFSH